MGKLLETADLFLGTAITHGGTTDSTVQEGLEKYENMMKQESFFNVKFDRVDKKGNFYYLDRLITVKMENKEVTGRQYDLKFKSDKLADEYCVMVNRVDWQEKIVYVSHFAAKEKVRPEIEKEIADALENGEYVKVKAKINRIYSRVVDEVKSDMGVWVDICGVGIPGYIHIGDWAQTFTPILRDRVKYGDVIEVIVKEKRIRPKTQLEYYACSRKELVEDPWRSPGLTETYHVGDLVRITCLSTHANYWFGHIKGLNEIQILGEYPSMDHQFVILPGMEYMGKIYHLNPQEHSFKVRVFQALTQEELNAENSKE